jgi:heat shock protein HslJ
MKLISNTFINTAMLYLIFLTLLSCKKENINIDITSDKWEVISGKESGQTFSDKPKEIYILHFSSDSTYRVKLDVNDCFGKYVIPEKGKIDFENAGCTEVCCDSEFAENLLKMLIKINGYFVKGDVLTLTGDVQIKLKRL